MFTLLDAFPGILMNEQKHIILIFVNENILVDDEPVMLLYQFGPQSISFTTLLSVHQ